MSKNYPGSTKCKWPKMTDHRGATWDRCDVIDANGNKVVGYLDTSWGHWFYFRDESNQARKARIDVFMNGKDNTADFRTPSK